MEADANLPAIFVLTSCCCRGPGPAPMCPSAECGLKQLQEHIYSLHIQPLVQARQAGNGIIKTSLYEASKKQLDASSGSGPKRPRAQEASSASGAGEANMDQLMDKLVFLVSDLALINGAEQRAVQGTVWTTYLTENNKQTQAARTCIT